MNANSRNLVLVAAFAILAVGCSEKADATHSPAPAPDSEKMPGSEKTATSTANKAAYDPSAPLPPPSLTPSAASPEQIAELSKTSGGPDGGMYTVKEGTKVDPRTLMGWKTWRALACDRCHGAEQQGLVGPPLTVSLHRLTKEEFKKTITDGRIEKGMPPFNTSVMVMENWEGLYAYLKGRADGQIQAGHLYPLDSQ